jgi:type III pantothenate kinase
MLLAVDVGNTEITLGLFEGLELRRSFRVSSETRRTVDEVELLLRQAFPELSKRSPDGKAHAAVVASVVPAQTAQFLEASRRITGSEPLEVTFEGGAFSTDTSFAGSSRT